MMRRKNKDVVTGVFAGDARSQQSCAKFTRLTIALSLATTLTIITTFNVVTKKEGADKSASPEVATTIVASSKPEEYSGSPLMQTIYLRNFPYDSCGESETM